MNKRAFPGHVCIGVLLAALMQQRCVAPPTTADPYVHPQSGKIVALEETTFDSLVLVDGRVAMIDFYSPLCGACQRMDSVVANLAVLYEGIALIGKVDIDVESTLSSKYGIQSVPTFVFFGNGEESGRRIGVTPQDSLAAIIDSLLAVQQNGPGGTT
jgi:thioredoxin 1